MLIGPRIDPHVSPNDIGALLDIPLATPIATISLDMLSVVNRGYTVEIPISSEGAIPKWFLSKVESLGGMVTMANNEARLCSIVVEKADVSKVGRDEMH